MRCDFKRYICERYVVLQHPGGHAFDVPWVDSAFDARTGKYVATASWGALGRQVLPDGGLTDCFCEGPANFSFPDVRECRANEVACAAGQTPGPGFVDRFDEDAGLP